MERKVPVRSFDKDFREEEVVDPKPWRKSTVCIRKNARGKWGAIVIEAAWATVQEGREIGPAERWFHQTPLGDGTGGRAWTRLQETQNGGPGAEALFTFWEAVTFSSRVLTWPHWIFAILICCRVWTRWIGAPQVREMGESEGRRYSVWVWVGIEQVHENVQQKIEKSRPTPKKEVWLRHRDQRIGSKEMAVEVVHVSEVWG